MKWQQYVHVAIGLSCWQIALHLLIIIVLVIGWISNMLVCAGIGICMLYTITVMLMLLLQRQCKHSCRYLNDILEELTTTWYFGTALIVLWLLSLILKNNLLLTLVGLVIFIGPATLSLLTKDKRIHSISSEHRAHH